MSIVAGIGRSEPAPDTILLPDSPGPHRLAWNEDSAHPQVYIGGKGDGGEVVVAEAIESERLARASAGPANALGRVPARGKTCAASHVVSAVRIAGEVP